MADPKYANLPGIDLNSPDVFESSDLPEDDQNLAKRPEELSSQSVEPISVSTDAAFKVFKGKGVDLGKTDFSDSVSKSRTIGYYADQTEYELLGQGDKKETAQQKYQRLQHEMRELAEEVGKIKDSVQQTDAGDSLSPVALGKQLEYLQHQLADLHLEKLLGPEAKVDLADPQGALRQRLLTQLEGFGAAGDKSKQKGAPGAGGDSVVYELFYKPEQAQFSKNARLAKLEERLDRLENVIGKNFDKTNVLTADTDNKSLIGSVAALNSKLSLLDASNTETVEARLNAVLQKMQQIAEKKEKEPQADPDKQKRISDLFELTKKWEASAETLPQVVDRLVSLQELHEQALQFSQALSYLDTAQQEVKANLAANSDMQKQLQSSLADNNKLIQQNVDSIEKRLKALGK
ncbi:dynactin subunit 2 isoform X2 [Aplysia californica]|uniref:Dynactin subunit 2 isoform X1 n=1 Tax=Aplysia californica TaxID=6500 RepID=A0ABM0JLE3_APLCA|nr:dynactin subunit 2 isoform X1 [Aplysia californica]XP_005096446.1 dynactin subunit 2 isoform X2 [Aplysia californica]